jgi:hypothetical protein
MSGRWIAYWMMIGVLVAAAVLMLGYGSYLTVRH